MTIKKDYLVALISLGLGLVVLVLTSQFPVFRVRVPGVPDPSFFPKIIGAALIVLAPVLWWEGRSSRAVVTLKVADSKGFVNLTVTVLLIVAFAVLLRPVGFLLTTFAFCAISMMTLRVGVIRSIIYAAVIALVMYYVFGTIFRLPLPRGIFSL